MLRKVNVVAHTTAVVAEHPCQLHIAIIFESDERLPSCRATVGAVAGL
jgi:hypothetical protein